MFRFTKPTFPTMMQRAFATPRNIGLFKFETATTQRDPTHEQMQAKIRELLKDPNLKWEEAVIDQSTLERFKNESEAMRRHTSY
jgi:hypothetical protein